MTEANTVATIPAPPEPIDTIVRSHVAKTLAYTNGNKADAAERLGISLKTLYNWLNKWAEQDAAQTNRTRSEPTELLGTEPTGTRAELHQDPAFRDRV